MTLALPAAWSRTDHFSQAQCLYPYDLNCIRSQGSSSNREEDSIYLLGSELYAFCTFFSSHFTLTVTPLDNIEPHVTVVETEAQKYLSNHSHTGQDPDLTTHSSSCQSNVLLHDTIYKRSGSLSDV